MKKNILKLAAALVASSALFAGCDLLGDIGGIGSTPQVTLTALSDAFDAQGEAVITVSLSSYALEDVTVALSVSGDAAAAVTLDKAVKLGVGSKSQPITVKVDLDAIKSDSTVKIGISSATGATVGTPSEVTLAIKAAAAPVEEPATLTLESDDEFAEDLTAKVTLKLNKALEGDVSVELQVLSSEDYATIPAEALQFDSPAVIAAGQTAAVVTVSLDPTDLPSGDNYAIIAIKAAEGNVSNGQATEAQILYTKSIVPNLREDWTIEYAGNYEYETDNGVVLYDLIGFYGLGEQQFIFDYYSAGTLAYNEMTPDDYVLYKAERNSAYIAEGATADDLGVITPTADPYGLLFNLFDPGEYEAILLACNADGSLTGDYTYATFEVVDPEEPTAEYSAWIGKWTIQGNTYYILNKWNNKSYNVYGFDSDFSFEVPVDYNPETNAIEFRMAYVDESSKYEFWLCAYTSDNYMAYGDPEQDYLIATLTTADGAYSIDPVTYTVTYNDGTTAERTPGAMGIMGYGLQESGWYSFSDVNYITLPCTDIAPVQQSSSVASVVAREKNLVSLGKPVANPDRVRKCTESKVNFR